MWISWLAQISSYYRFRSIYLINRFRPIFNILSIHIQICGTKFVEIKMWQNLSWDEICHSRKSLPDSRSQTHVQTFATNFWLDQTFATDILNVQTFATAIWNFQTFDHNDPSDRIGDGATETSRPIFGIFRLTDQDLPFPDFCYQKTRSWFLRPSRNEMQM